MITAVPPEEIKKRWPNLEGPFWNHEGEGYTLQTIKEVHWIVYGPVALDTFIKALGIFKSVKIVDKETIQ